MYPELISSKQVLWNKCLILRPARISGKTNRPLYLGQRMRLQSQWGTRHIISWSTLENKGTKALLIHEKPTLHGSQWTSVVCGIILNVSWLVSVSFHIFLSRRHVSLGCPGHDLCSSIIGHWPPFTLYPSNGRFQNYRLCLFRTANKQQQQNPHDV